MASQPANSTISVFRTLRSIRGDTRHETVKSLTHGLRGLQLQIPGLERPATRTISAVSSSSGITTYDENGRPLVVGVKAVVDFNVIETLTGVDMPFEIGRDKFIENTSAGLASTAAGADLQAQARTKASNI